MKIHLRLLGAFTSLIVLLALPVTGSVSAAGSPGVTASLSPATSNVHQGDNVRLVLHVDGNGTDINTVSAVVNFPASKLTFVGLDKSGSFFDTVIPATPTANDGKLEFSAASLSGGATNKDVLVETLIFSANVSSSSAQINLDGSQAAESGTAYAISSDSASVAFTAASGGSANPVSISGLTVSGVTPNGGVIHWHTTVPTSGSVDYGANTKYGFTASTSELSIDHAVTLDPVFSGNSAIHYRVTSVDADAHTQTSGDQIFVTSGYHVAIKVTDKQGKTVAGARVSVASGKEVKTDASGVANISGVAPGNQKVVINGGKAQLIAVKSVTGKDAAKTQQFTLVVEHSSVVLLVIASVVLLAVLVLSLWGFRKSVHRKSSAE